MLLSRPPLAAPPARRRSASGLALECNRNGSLRRFDCDDITLNLFVGTEVEGGPANLHLRTRTSEGTTCCPLLGPRSATRFDHGDAACALTGSGDWQGLHYRIALTLADGAPAWFWHLRVHNASDVAQTMDVVYAQDLALAPYGAVRLNEYYVSQYLDHTPLVHAVCGTVVATRQNQAAAGRHPWCVIGSLRRGVSFATDALQVHGLAGRSGGVPQGLADGLPGERLQHEHAMVAIEDAPLTLAPGESATLGFFGWYAADHPLATSDADSAAVDVALALPEAAAPALDIDVHADAFASPAGATLFSTAPLLDAIDADARDLQAWFGAARRHEERDAKGRLLSFFHGDDRHVVLRAKELAVLRPHGHLLRSGHQLTPDETALTSTVWMGGVFHSMLTEGHVSINRLLSTTHSYIGLFRSHGQRVFVEIDGEWQLFDVPSAFEMAPEACRWIYRHAGGVIAVRSEAHCDSHAMSLEIEVLQGSALRFLVSHHVAMNGDDGSTPGALRWSRDSDNGGDRSGSDLSSSDGVNIFPAAQSELARRFPRGSLRIEPAAGTRLERVGGDELLFVDGSSHAQPYLCIVTAPARSVGLRLLGRLVASAADTPDLPAPDTVLPRLAPGLRIDAPAGSPLAAAMARLADIVPWFAHNAFVHYLSPRGLEQYSGGGWGTRDVCQGPVELLLALGRPAPVRDLLLRVVRAQNADGDWPQWFMFFERDRAIRAGDSHGDIVFWPLLALAQYLLATGDASVLDEPAPYYRARITTRTPRPTVWRHVRRALALIRRRVIAGTALAAYGHGDWNDALQPADPAMREHMCSAWTVTLHHQTLTTLAHALHSVGRARDAAPLQSQAQAVARDFQRLLVVDGVLTGYALFDAPERVRYLLHPHDAVTGVRYSALAMIHAILEDLLTPEQAREHLELIETRLSGPDGVRLFDRPLAYHGGLQRHFQRAESATFFGREIGLMYMHAHLRWAQALAHLGEAERFFRALCQAVPIGIREIVPSATLRQANCYFSSSDAAFRDRAQASAEYDRVLQGTIALEGGWRVYSSGAGIALGLIVRHLLGLDCQAATLRLDPVLPAALDGLRIETALWGRPVAVTYRVRGKGCGVDAVALDGEPLAFERAANPHRPGAVRIAKALFDERLRAGSTLAVCVGSAA
jgi:cellobiose phosphorylase